MQAGADEGQGTRLLAVSSSTWLACLAFPVVYLTSVLVGATWSTALIRGLIAALLVRLIGPFLLHLLVDTILQALARHEQAKKEAEDK